MNLHYKIIRFFPAIFLLTGLHALVKAQSYHAMMNGLNNYTLDITNGNTCTFELLGNSNPGLGCGGLSSTPDSLLVVYCTPEPFSPNGLKEIDQITGWISPYFDYDFGMDNNIAGVAAVDQGVFYVLSITSSNTSGLYRINVNNGIVTYLGLLPYASNGDLTLFNGDLYYAWTTPAPFNYLRGIVKVDPNNPGDSELVVEIPGDMTIRTLTASNICNTLLAGTTGNNHTLYYINLIDGVITTVCEHAHFIYNVSGLIEFESISDCPIYLDLDKDDSSGLPEADFQSDDFDCNSEPVPISDQDNHVLYDALISEMHIEIAGFIPDGVAEILELSASIPNIEVTGNGTGMLTLVNNGEAKSTDFKEALRQIKYNNLASSPTGGQRTINIQFSTESGAMSNIAVAYIQVNQLPAVPVDLGDDIEICDGVTIILDAGNPGADFAWSTGQSSQSITVNTSGIYRVTVNDGVNCPGEDTVIVNVIPFIQVSLSGDQQVCENQNASISIFTNSIIPINVEILSSTGSIFNFSNITGTFTFMDVLTEETEYEISNVTTSQNTCIALVDSVHVVEMNSVFLHFFDIALCGIDSTWLGYSWENEAGVYENLFTTFDGCDSLVTTTITLMDEINISKALTTCDPSAVGNFITYLSNPGGCDTIVTTVVSLLHTDTTFTNSTTCSSANAGVFTQSLTSIDGCDSIVINTIILSPPSDTTFVHQSSCDPSQTGISQQLFTDQHGCDSLVVVSVTLAPTDTTYKFATSCDSAAIGIVEEHLITSEGCDSTVFTTITYSPQDSTFLQNESCNPDETGVFISVYLNRFGCDSIVITSVNLLSGNETFITSTTCDPSAAGVFVESLINQFGCDSIITETINLLQSDETSLYSTTCTSAEAGVYVSNYLNQAGCDSLVTLTVSLIPADTTLILQKTCNPALIGYLETVHTNQDGCDSIVIEQTTLYPLPELEIEVTSDYNGYAISCFGQSDGSAKANVVGSPPFAYTWSTSETEQDISGLIVGSYSVTVTDGNGCTVSGEVMLTEPDEFSLHFIVSQPDCFNHDDGRITIVQSGGTEPVRYSIDQINYQLSPDFNQLSGGIYTVTAIDANNCETKEIIWINVPLMVNVELGDDQLIFPGDTAIIKAIVNVPYDSLATVTWSGLNNPDCQNCLTQAVSPVITTSYSISVTSLDGCMDEDIMTLFLENNEDIYVPNIFSPNADGVNDQFLINTGNSVEEIKSMIIYDRWGEVVFERNNFLPDLTNSWDGKMNGIYLNPGVFVYRLIIQFHDGTQKVSHGDITLNR